MPLERESSFFKLLRLRGVHLMAAVATILIAAMLPFFPVSSQTTNWTLANINTSGTGTFSTPGAGQFTLNAAGNGLSGTTDSISFLNILTSGNVEMITRVVSQQAGTNDYAPAGLTIRASNSAAGAIHATVVVTPKNGANFLTRSQTNGSTSQTLGPSAAAPTWLRIVKSGQTIAGYQSSNGYSWTLVGETELDINQPFYIGFVGASMIDPSLRTYAFSNSVFMRDVPQRSDDMALWLRSDVGVTANGSSVSAWLDQSNNTYSAAQPTAINQPSIATNAINGLSALNFAGSTKWLRLPSGYADFTKGASVFVVMKPPSTGLADARVFDFANGASNSAFRLSQPTKDGLSFLVNNGGNTSVTTATGMGNAYKLAEVVHDGNATATILINGAQVASSTAMNAIPNIEREGNFIGKANGNSAYYEGQIAEILIFKRALSDPERKSIESYFFYKYGLGTAPGVAPPTISATVAGTPPQTFTPATGVYASSVTVTMNADPLSQIRYTTNGSNPGPGSTLYTAPFVVSSTSTIKAIAIEGASQSPITTTPIQIDANSSNVSRVGMNLWLKADLAVEKDGSNLVSRWEDVSGNHLDAVSLSNKPLFVSADSSINNSPVIDFNGSSQWLQMPKGFDSFVEGASIFVIAKPTTSTSNARFLDLSNGTNTDAIQLYMQNSSELRYRVYNPTQTSTDAPVTLNSFQLIEVIHSGSTVSIFNNGTPSTPATGFNTIPTIARSGNFIGKSFSTSNYFQGRIAEIIIYNRALVPAERVGIEAYAYAKYGLGVQPQLAAPVISPKSDIVCEPSKFITMEAANSANIYYTVGTPSSPPPDPTAASTLYSAPIEITSSTVLKAIAVKSGYISSAVSSATYLFDSTTCALRTDALVTWLRSDVGVTYDGSNNVSAWADQSGKGANATTSGSMPTRIASGINGLPSISFASSQFLNLPALTEYSNFTQGITAFVVAKQTGATGGSFFGLSNASNADAVFFGPSSSTSLQLSVYTGTTATNLTATSALDNNFHVYEAVHNGGTVASLFKDGAQLAQGVSMNPITNTTRSVNTIGKGTANFQGQIAEILIYRKELQPDERREVENYLLARYGSVVTAPTISPAGGVLPDGYPITMTAKDPGAQIYYGVNGGAQTNLYNPATPPTMSSSINSIQAKAVLSWGQSTSTNADFQLDNNTKNLPRSDMSLWLKADFGITKDGSNKVSQWKDISGANQNATQSTSTYQPVYVASSINGLPSLTFSGSQWMQFPAGMKDFTNGATIFLVTKPTAVTSNARFFDFSNQSSATFNNNIVFSQPASTSSEFSVYDGATASAVTATSSVTLNQFQLLEVEHTGRKAATVYSDGTKRVIATINNAVDVSRAANYLGKAYNNSLYFQGAIAEMMIYNRALLPDERRNVEAYLIGRYGLASGKVVQPTVAPYDGVYTGMLATGGTNPISISAFPGAQIRYTTDGTTPTTSSPIYGGPFQITKSTVVKAIAIQGANSSSITTRYFNISPQADLVSRAGLSLWYKSDFGLIHDATKAQKWIDLSTSGTEVNASQPTANHQPYFRSDYAFDRIRTGLDQTGHHFMNIEPGFSDFNSGLTFFGVIRPLSIENVTDSWIFNASNGETTDNLEVRDDTNAERARFRIRRGSSQSNVVSSGDSLLFNKFQVLECVQNGSGNVGTIYVDGVQKGSSTVQPANNITRLLNGIGANPTTNVESFVGDYVEVLLYNRPLSEGERQSVEIYLKSKYQTPVIQNVAKPVLLPAGGTYSAPLDVALIAPTAGAKIYFTTNGDVPDPIHGELYTKPVRINFTRTLKAVAILNDLSSPLEQQTYTLNAIQWPPKESSSGVEKQIQAPTLAIPQ